MLYGDERKAVEKMHGDAHQQAALDIEQAITKLGGPAAHLKLCHSIIELYWGNYHGPPYGLDRKQRCPSLT